MWGVEPSGGPPGATKPILRKQQASQNDSSNWDSQWDSLAHGLFTAGLKPTIRRNTDNTLEVFSVSSNNLHYSYPSTPNGQILQGSMSNSQNVGHFGDPVVRTETEQECWRYFL